MKKIIIIAGPNGAGKTTFARDFLPAEAQTRRFINADLIAAGLAPFNPEKVSLKAGRLMLEEIDECVDAGNIPEDVIRRRFKAGLANFHDRYSKVVDSWAFYDSSGMHPKLIDWNNK